MEESKSVALSPSKFDLPAAVAAVQLAWKQAATESTSPAGRSARAAVPSASINVSRATSHDSSSHFGSRTSKRHTYK